MNLRGPLGEQLERLDREEPLEDRLPDVRLLSSYRIAIIVSHCARISQLGGEEQSNREKRGWDAACHMKKGVVFSIALLALTSKPVSHSLPERRPCWLEESITRSAFTMWLLPAGRHIAIMT